MSRKFTQTKQIDSIIASVIAELNLNKQGVLIRKLEIRKARRNSNGTMCPLKLASYSVRAAKSSCLGYIGQHKLV